MTTIVHETPGLLPMEALTLFGAHAKPNTRSPIGRFGTGLKYAVAVLLREGVPVRLWRGTEEWEFYVRPQDFRGSEVAPIRARRRNGILKKFTWSYVRLPFTTALGRDWRLWQALRELHANTMDEGGTTYRYDGHDSEFDPEHLAGSNGSTMFIVGPHAGYTEEHARLGDLFLPSAGRDVPPVGCLVEKRPSKHLYFRGMRAMDLPEKRPAIHQWDVRSPLELTEDRTVKYEFLASTAVASHVLQSDDEQLVSSVVSAPKDSWESTLDWSYTGVAPSATFRRIMEKKQRRGGYIAPSALGYYSRYQTLADEERPWELRAAEMIRANDWGGASSLLYDNQRDLADVLETHAHARAAAEEASRVQEMILTHRDTGAPIETMRENVDD